MVTYLNSYLAEKKPENLHQFRIQFKKVSALLILSENSLHHCRLTHYFKPVKKIFKSAGELRDFYIGQAVGGNRQTLEKAVQNFCSKKHRYWRKIGKSRCKLITRIKPVKYTAINKFYDTELRKTAATFMAAPSDADMHKCRKRIKILLYNEKLARDSLSTRVDWRYLDQLQEMIGRWRDQAILLAASKKGSTTTRKLTKQQSQQRKDIENIASNFYQRATYLYLSDTYN